jgi:hypothetical protein
MSTENKYFPPNGLRVCIEKGDGVHLEGRFYSPLSEKVFSFCDFQELLLKADSLFDQVGYPQSFQKKRSFQQEDNKYPAYNAHPTIYRQAGEILKMEGGEATFDILVVSRSKANWQGFVNDKAGKRIGRFQDVVQLINYLAATYE